MKNRWIRLCCFLPLALACLAGERDHVIDIDDYFSLAEITALKLSPDARHVAYCEARWRRQSDDQKADLWVVPTTDNPVARRLTMERAGCRFPTWSADGQLLYFLADRKRGAETHPPFDGSTQVWRVGVHGGEPQPVTQVEGGVSSYDLATGTDQLFYAVNATAIDDDAFTKLRAELKTLKYQRGQRRVSEVWRMDLQTWRADKIIAENRYVHSFAVTADGRRLAMVSAIDDSVVAWEGESRVDIWEDGKVSTPSTDGYGSRAATSCAWLESLAWSRDGLHLAFCAVFDGYPADIILASRSEGEWPAKLMPRPGDIHVRRYGAPLHWDSTDRVIFIAEREGRSFVTSSDPEMIRRHVETTPADRDFLTFDLGNPTRVEVYLVGTPDSFPDLYLMDPAAGTSLRRLTRINPQTDSWKLPTLRHVSWKSRNGTTVSGILELPAGHQAGRKLPLIVGVHGGPASSEKMAQKIDPTSARTGMTRHGYAVFCPNYRGSTGYGDSFQTQLVAHENDIDVADIVSGVESLIRDAIADPERIGVMGWSNGGLSYRLPDHSE